MSLPLNVAGAYGVLTPFYNGVFSGKLSRFDLRAPWNPVDVSVVNVQELDTTVHRFPKNVFKGKNTINITMNVIINITITINIDMTISMTIAEFMRNTTSYQNDLSVF